MASKSNTVEEEEEELTLPTDEYEALISTTDVELLKRAWRNEKSAPEILRFESDLINRVTEQIQLMEETVEENSTDDADPLSLSLYQMDLDRTLFLLRSYLRVRIQKIEKYMFHIRKTEELWNRLSKEEKKFTRGKDYLLQCTDDLKKHVEENVLSRLPENYQSVLKQSVISEEDDMVPEPLLDTFVLCRSKESKLFEMEPGVLYFICYKSIKALVESGKIDLL
ncbi:hypothetical protein Lal_00023402 [Lupinus albus]|nr:hypothetical protein Lal_00023402 [Lupinus albus]